MRPRWRRESVSEATSPTLIVHCRERIGYKAPEEIVFLDEMPLNPTGKIDRVSNGWPKTTCTRTGWSEVEIRRLWRPVFGRS